MRRYFLSRYFCMGSVVLLLGIALGRGSKVRIENLAEPTNATDVTDDSDPPRQPKFNCLPKDVTQDDVVEYRRGRKDVTVQGKLMEMKARCEKGKLVDARSKEIRFFRTSCWGNPPADYQEIRKQENEDLEKLKRRYTVIVFGCDPMIQ